MVDMMTDGMVFIYLHTADLCFGLCDQAMGEFFMMVLDNKSLTMDFMACAESNPELIKMMIRVVSTNSEILPRMAEIMAEDCDFPATFVSMASWHGELRRFFFNALDDQLYQALTRSMLCEPPDIVQILGSIMEEEAALEMRRGRPFWEVYMNLGSSALDTDANELADERMFYAFLHNTTAAHSMFRAMGSMGEAEQAAVLDFMFLGRSHGRAGPQEHPRQAYFNIYAITEAFMTGVAPLYEMEAPPDPQSENPANALLGRMLQFLIQMDEQGQIINFSPYAALFFRALRSGAEIHCDPYSLGMMQFMAGLFPLEIFATLPPPNPDAPSPRDYKNLGAPLDYQCPAPECSLFAPMLCGDEASCLSAGLSWCGGECMPLSRCPEPECGSQSPESCGDIWSCYAMNLSWCEQGCQTEPCPLPVAPDLGPPVDMALPIDMGLPERFTDTGQGEPEELGGNPDSALHEPLPSGHPSPGCQTQPRATQLSGLLLLLSLLILRRSRRKL